jgi:DNA-binding MarR family transcriptional regulator
MVSRPDRIDAKQSGPAEGIAFADIKRAIQRRPGHLVRRLHQIATSVFAFYGNDYGLTALQYVTLVIVETFPGIDQSGVGRLAALDRTTTSDVVRRLAAKGLLDRKQAKRKTSLYLTGAGRGVIYAMDAVIDKIDEVILAPLDAKERGTLIELLSKLQDENDPCRAILGYRSFEPKVRAKGSKPKARK